LADIRAIVRDESSSFPRFIEPASLQIVGGADVTQFQSATQTCENLVSELKITFTQQLTTFTNAAVEIISISKQINPSNGLIQNLF
jgi:hypothetical protein